MFGKLANFLGAAIPGMYIGIFGKDSPLPFLYTGVTYCVIMIISLAFLYFNSWERPYEEVADEEVPNFIEGIKKLFVDIISTLKIKSFREHLGMYLFGFGAEWLFTACFTYFIVFCLKQPSTLVSELNSMSSILQLISTALFIGIVSKKGFTKPFIGALSVVIAAIMCYFGIFVFHTGHMTLLVAFVTIIFGLGTGGVYYIPWTAYTFMADVDEIVTNRRREGVYAGAMTMAGKLMRASIVFILGQVLAAFGFVSGASVQPESAINAIAGVLLIGVGGMAVIGIIFSQILSCEGRDFMKKELLGVVMAAGMIAALTGCG